VSAAVLVGVPIAQHAQPERGVTPPPVAVGDCAPDMPCWDYLINPAFGG
jgi:hypothetical protein